MHTKDQANEFTGNPTWSDIFECCFKAQSSKLERLFSLKRGKRDVQALSSKLSKMSPQVAVHMYHTKSVCTRMRTRMHTQLLRMRVCMRVQVRVLLCACSLGYACMLTWIHICMYIFECVCTSI